MLIGLLLNSLACQTKTNDYKPIIKLEHLDVAVYINDSLITNNLYRREDAYSLEDNFLDYVNLDTVCYYLKAGCEIDNNGILYITYQNELYDSPFPVASLLVNNQIYVPLLAFELTLYLPLWQEDSVVYLFTDNSLTSQIPVTLDEAYILLDKLCLSSVRRELKQCSLKEPSIYHRLNKDDLCETWLASDDEEIVKFFQSVGINDKERMSCYILLGYHLNLNDEPCQIDDVITYPDGLVDNQ